MTRAISIRPLARSDLSAIWDFTVEHWGVEQAKTYLDALKSDIAGLAKTPMRGQDRGDLYPGLRKILSRSHLIFYLHDGEKLEIVRILHARMDARSALTGN